jgi:hypothetical protein
LRPLLNIGGQDILALTEVEKLQEIRDYTLFDIPVPEGEDVENPIYVKNERDKYYRYYGLDGNWRPQYLYKSKPRQYSTSKMEQARMKTMRPIMKPSVGIRTPFFDPYERRRFNTPNSAYRHSESSVREYADRAGCIYPDVAAVSTPLQPYNNDSVSNIDLMLSLK